VNDSSVSLELIFALKQTNLDKLEKLFWAVSNPDSPSYGKFLTMEQVQALVRPTEETVSAVLEWLAEFDVTEVNHVNDYVIVSVPVEEAKRMLHCEFYHFEHAVADKRIIRAATDYSLPHHVASTFWPDSLKF
jgi:tripeptidyl-peptidase-1